MSLAHRAGPGAATTAADVLTGVLADALTAPGGTFTLRAALDGRVDPVRALGALRASGADVLLPFLVAGHPLTPGDAALVRAAVTAFPAPAPGAPEGAAWALRDAALTRALAVLGVPTHDWEGLATHRLTALTETTSLPDPAAWTAWGAEAARLSTLASPPVTGTCRTRFREHAPTLTRGLVHAILRHDHLAAARIARWLALDAAGAPDPLLPAALTHLAALGPHPPRTLFELAVARRLLGGAG
ncbi:hypothetical protein [Streptomyces avicenniae]|uniref:hypothetical protein n=1 Tax=Streptomyces avicenniae TaxID=500153 RepID=UPI00069C5D08|nr:hypothetical protein [Streptomyces avicenniae]